MSIGNLVGQGLSVITSTVIAIDDREKQDKLNKYLAKLSFEQKTELEKKMIEAKTTMERQRLLFQMMAVDKNNSLIEKTSKEKKESFIILSASILIFGALIFISRRKNG